MSWVRGDVVALCVEHALDDVCLLGPDSEPTAVALRSAGVRADTDVGRGHAFTIALADSAVGDLSRLAHTTVVGGVALVEAMLPATGIELTPVLVEVDRVSLRGFDGRTTTRFDLVNGGSRAQLVSPLRLESLDSRAAAVDMTLVDRWADTSGARFGPRDPAHLSWFRNGGSGTHAP